MRAIAVAVPVPGIGTLTYSVPDGLPDPSVGARVLVPVGTRTLTGVVVSDDRGSRFEDRGSSRDSRDVRSSILDPRPSDLRPLIDVLDGEPFLPADVVEL